MRVLFLNYEYPPLGGGAANATAYIMEEYSKLPDLSVDLITSSIDSEYHLDKIGQNIFIHRLPIGKNKNNLHFQSQKDLLVYAWKAYFFSKKLVKKNNYNLSHSFFAVPCGFISLLLKWKFKIPYTISLRGSDVPGYSDRFQLLYKFITPLTKLIWRKAAAVVANSEGLKELALKSAPEQEIGIIYNGINTNDFKPNPEAKSSDKFIITTGASRITDRKGIDYLIRAIKELSSDFPQLFLRAMGDGNARENLEKLAKDLGVDKNVDFIGRVPREDTTPYYQEANIFVLPSLNEGMSNAMLEALACGLPIVATDTGGTKELVTEGKNGFIVKMKDSHDLAEKIKKFLLDRELEMKMGHESRQLAEKLDWSFVAEKYFDLYKKTENSRKMRK